jgi:hypothetical protein
VTGAWRLHEATAGLTLDWFVLSSSAVSLVSRAGQGNYCAANGWAARLGDQLGVCGEAGGATELGVGNHIRASS